MVEGDQKVRRARTLIFASVLIAALIATFVILGDRFLKLGHEGTLEAILVCFILAVVAVICSLIGVAIGWHNLAKDPTLRTIWNRVTIAIGLASIGAFVFWVWPK